MAQGRFIQPDSCEIDKQYYLRSNGNGSGVLYKEVRFLSYRPHPAEVLIHDGVKPRVIHRCFLFERVPGNGQDGRSVPEPDQ